MKTRYTMKFISPKRRKVEKHVEKIHTGTAAQIANNYSKMTWAYTFLSAHYFIELTNHTTGKTAKIERKLTLFPQHFPQFFEQLAEQTR